MKIQLLCDVPLGKEHGMTEGRVLEVVRSLEGSGRGLPVWFVIGDAAIEVGVLHHEAEVIEEER